VLPSEFKYRFLRSAIFLKIGPQKFSLEYSQTNTRAIATAEKMDAVMNPFDVWAHQSAAR
jgi:hypothetical protein